MILVAYTAPAFGWFANLFSPHAKVKKAYAMLYLVSHLLVEAYALVLPLLWMLRYWNDPTLSITIHPLFHNQGNVLGQVTVKFYLIMNSCLFGAMIFFTFYCFGCLWSYAVDFGKAKEEIEAKERLLVSQKTSFPGDNK